MSLMNALFSSVSGLETASTQISVIGDNIANAEHTGLQREARGVLGGARSEYHRGVWLRADRRGRSCERRRHDLYTGRF